MKQLRTALFPGTFDPYTNGHLDLTRRAARMFERVVVAVAPSPAKGTLFPVDERVELIEASVRSLKHVEVIAFEDLLVDCARRVGASAIIRGLRAVSDFEYEFQMALMNRRLAPMVEVVFMMPSQEYSYLNSTLVKEVARLGGDVGGLVPRIVETRLRQRLLPPATPRAASRRSAKGRAR
jgi:pantetheine-phosphate adenylyltransferase